MSGKHFYKKRRKFLDLREHFQRKPDVTLKSRVAILSSKIAPMAEENAPK
jgi:hypothetical protein